MIYQLSQNANYFLFSRSKCRQIIENISQEFNIEIEVSIEWFIEPYKVLNSAWTPLRHIGPNINLGLLDFVKVWWWYYNAT